VSALRLFLVPAALLCLMPLHAHGAEADGSDPLRPWQWLEGQRDQVSRNVTGLGVYLDDWLAGEVAGDEPNETFLRVRFDQLQGTYSDYNSKLKFGGRLDLPRTSERWKLIFESDVEDLNSLNENRLENTASDFPIGGFRYEHSSGNGWDFSHDIGLRARVPLDPFYRFRTHYGRDLNSRWSMGFEQKYWYFNSRGFGYDTTVSFSQELAPDRFLRIASQVHYRNEDNVLEAGQSVTLHRTLGPLATLSYEAGVLGANKPNTRINDYYVQALFRKAVYEDWLIVEMAPQLLMARQENWRPEPRFFLNLEVLFFDF
jgi:hypothetical protein